MNKRSPAVQRRLLDLLAIDNAADVRTVSLDQRRLGGHLDRGVGLAYREDKILAQSLLNVQVKMADDLGLKAARRDAKLISAGLDIAEGVIAVAVALLRQHHAARLVAQRNCRVGDHAAGGVRYPPHKAAARRLCAAGKRQGREQHHKK